jgi:hypothetical protein
MFLHCVSMLTPGESMPPDGASARPLTPPTTHNIRTGWRGRPAILSTLYRSEMRSKLIARQRDCLVGTPRIARRIWQKPIAGAAHAQKMLRAGRVFFEVLAQVDNEIVDRASGRAVRHSPHVFQ